MTIWIKGGRVIDPGKRIIEDLDVIVEDGKIKALLPPGSFKEAGEKVIVVNAEEKLVLPGLVDMHVHLREPGFEYKETIETGTRAAVAGGFTAVACMPNTEPVNDCRAVTEFILEQAHRAGLSKVCPVACITVGQKGERLIELGEVREAGAVGISDDGYPVKNSELMRRAIEYAAYHGLTVISHCEDTSLTGKGVMHEGVVSTRMGLRGIPAASEEVMVFREIALAKLTGCPVHIAHVSTAGSVELIKRAKDQGVRVTAETAPHYFTLDHRAVEGFDTNAKVNPPLRTPQDVDAIREGLKQGGIDVIATDHAPHSPLEKEVEFDLAAPGMIGLQSALPLTLALVREGVLELLDAVAKLTCNPSRILGIEGGEISEGCVADLTIVDPDVEYLFDRAQILSKSKNSPFLGKRLRGWAEVTIVGGKIVWERVG